MRPASRSLRPPKPSRKQAADFRQPSRRLAKREFPSTIRRLALPNAAGTRTRTHSYACRNSLRCFQTICTACARRHADGPGRPAHRAQACGSSVCLAHRHGCRASSRPRFRADLQSQSPRASAAGSGAYCLQAYGQRRRPGAAPAGAGHAAMHARAVSFLICSGCCTSTRPKAPAQPLPALEPSRLLELARRPSLKVIKAASDEAGMQA